MPNPFLYIKTIPFSISTRFVLFDSEIRPYRVLPLRVDLGAMAIKGYSAFPKASDCLVSYPGHSLLGSYPFSEKQSVCSNLRLTGQHTQSSIWSC